MAALVLRGRVGTRSTRARLAADVGLDLRMGEQPVVMVGVGRLGRPTPLFGRVATY